MLYVRGVKIAAAECQPDAKRGAARGCGVGGGKIGGSEKEEASGEVDFKEEHEWIINQLIILMKIRSALIFKIGSSEGVGGVVVDVQAGVVFEHPLGFLEEFGMLPQFSHHLVDVVSLVADRELLLVQLIL